MPRTRIVVLALGAVLLLLSCAGKPDPSFGTKGVAVADFGGTKDFGGTILRDAADRYVTVGADITGDTLALEVARFLHDGSLDRTFAGDGTLKLRYHGLSTSGTAGAMLPDGRILVAGLVEGQGMAVLRLDASGRPDPTFGDHGWVFATIGSLLPFASGIVVQPDGRIVVCGEAQRPATNSDDFVVARFMPDGATDTSFGGTDGILTTDMGGEDQSASVLVDHAGRIVVVGTRLDPSFDPRLHRIAIARYLRNGSLDPTFGDGGRVTSVTGQAASGVLTPKDRVLVAGTRRSDSTVGQGPMLARFDTDGSLDTRFGTRGVEVADLGPPETDVFGLALESDGRADVAGAVADTITGLDEDAAVMRFTSTGQPDASFGHGGLARFDLGGESGAFDVLEQPNGKLLVVGDNGEDLVVMRLLGRP